MTGGIQDSLSAAWAARDHADGLAEAVYAALKKTHRLQDHRIIAYRCESRRCLLLDVLRTPDQIIVHSPPYRLSPAKNAADSSESGRAKNTRDGDRRWRGHTYNVASALNFTLNCDHVVAIVLDKADLQDDLNAGRAEVVVRADGTRYAIDSRTT